MIVQWTPLHQTAAEAVARVACSRRCAGSPCPNPDVSRLWLGHLEAANPNDRGLEGIVRAAADADCPRRDEGFVHFPCVIVDNFDIAAFLSALALEAIAKGQRCNTCEVTIGDGSFPCMHKRGSSWFDTHPRFEIDGRAFEIPPIAIAR